VTKGWKIETDNECWTVALPKAIVSGEIVVNGKKMKVNGVGYHDHNWNYSILTVMNYGRGWYWGKITSKSFNIVWANIIKTAKKSEILAVVNQDKNGFYNIDPRKIFFKVENFIRIHGRKTPTCFTLQIDDVIKDISVKTDIKMKSENIHFDKALLAPYWRYHMNTAGYISIGNKKEQVNLNHIMEFLSFS
jgi:predicted secreted hydrolase